MPSLDVRSEIPWRDLSALGGRTMIQNRNRDGEPATAGQPQRPAKANFERTSRPDVT
jgi:hypothetical protein